MISIQRLNLDSSWIFKLGGKSFLVDPWLSGPEIDGFSWFNEQHHVRQPVTPGELPAYDHVLISQSYEDHCHLQTLRELPGTANFIATGKPSVRLKKAFPEAPVTVIPEFPAAPTRAGDVEILAFHPGRKIDPVYYALLLAVDGKAIFYASHGFTLTADQAGWLRDRYEFKLLISTFTHYRLPAFLGGDVNPGTENARALVEALRPQSVVGTHDEQKQGKGLISMLARVTYPDFGAITLPCDATLLTIEDYMPVILE